MQKLAAAAALFVCAALSACTSLSDSIEQNKAGQVLLQVDPAAAAADGNTALVLTVTVLSRGGAPLSGLQASLRASDARISLQQPGLTDGQGQAQASATSAVVTDAVVFATVDAPGGPTVVAQGIAVKFVAPAAPAPVVGVPMVTLVATPAAAVADGLANVALRVTATDANGQPFAGAKVTLSGGQTSDVFAAASGTLFADGSFGTTFAGTVAGGRHLLATVNDLQGGANVVLQAGAASASRSALSLEARPADADGHDALAVHVQVADAFGNPVAGEPVVLHSNDAGVVFTPSQGFTDSLGQFMAVVTSSNVGLASLQAQVGGVSLPAQGNFVVGPPTLDQSSFVVPAGATTADGSSFAALTLLVRDAGGHPVAGVPVLLRAVGANANATSVSSDSNVSDAAGSLAVTVRSTAVGAAGILASVQDVNVGCVVPFVAGSPFASTSLLQLGQPTLVADGNSSTSLVTTLRDSQGHPVGNQAVQLSSPAAQVSFSPSQGSTDANGRWAATVRGTQAGNALLVATVPGTSLSATLALVAGPATAATSTLTASPSSLVADGTSSSTLTLQARDAFGNPVANVPVVLSPTGVAVILATPSGTTDATGRFSAVLRGQHAGNVTVGTSLGGQPLAVPVQLWPGNANAAWTVLLASPNDAIVANANAAATLTVTVRDAYNNPVPGQSVLLSSDGAGDSIAAPSGLSSLAGSYVSQLRASRAGSKVVTASLASVTTTTSARFIAGPPTAPASSFAALPAGVTADGVSASTLTLLARDSFGNAAGNVPVSIASNDGNDTLDPSTGVTNAAGLFVSAWRSTTAR